MSIKDPVARREYDKQWRAKHRDEINARARAANLRRYARDEAYRERKKREAGARQKRTYWADPEKGRARSRANAKLRRERYPDRARAEQKRYRERNRERLRVLRSKAQYRALTRRYGPLDHFDHANCNACGVQFSSASRSTWRHLDHDHGTGKARGFLCHRCNSALGMVRDDLRVLESLSGYLKRSTHARRDPSQSK